MATVQSEDGVLKFQNWAQSQAALHALNQLPWDEVEAFYETHQIQAQHRMLHKIVDAEWELSEQEGKAYPTATSMEEAKAQGFQPGSHSPEYLDALQKGLLSVEQDDEEAHTYFYSVMDPTLAPLINEKGLVIIGDTLLMANASQVKMSMQGGLDSYPQLYRASETDLEAGIYVRESASNSLRSQFSDNWNWCRNSSNCNQWTTVAWANNGTQSRRARYQIFGNSSIVGCQAYVLECDFYVGIWAQRRASFGRWKTANDYRPTFTFNGNWDFEARATTDNNCCLNYCSPVFDENDFNLAFGNTNSPMNNRTYFGNNSSYAFPMQPHTAGFWPPPSQHDWTCTINMNINSFGCTVNGVSLGGI